MIAQCLINDRDFRMYWTREISVTHAFPHVWNGKERRSGAERRAKSHDRRWNGEAGRRDRFGDRRTK